LVKQSAGLTDALKTQVDRMEKLFEASNASLPQLLQARQRLIQLENTELDAVWQATQAQADLLISVGAPALIAALQQPNQGVYPASAPTAPDPRGPVAATGTPATRR
jgi:cobalt-zinc-cadmium efflux system outer membrane protein